MSATIAWKQFQAKKEAYLAYARPWEKKIASFLTYRPEASPVTTATGPLLLLYWLKLRRLKDCM